MTFRVRPTGDNDSWDVKAAPFGCRLQRDHFRCPESAADKRNLFKTTVRNVVLELSAYCNRRCGFCPNRELTRFGEERLLAEPIFNKIIEELAEIEFGGSVLFHLYNEPLAAPEVLLARVAYARDRLPLARFSLNTNGDYLDLAMATALEAAGMNHMFVSIYGPRHGEWEDDYVRRRVLMAAERLGVIADLVEVPGQSYSVSPVFGRMKLDICARNLWNTGSDRGGTVPELARKRTSPCLAPATEFIVDHRGWVLPCCNVYTDFESHLAHVIGRLENQSIFDAYASGPAQAWRTGLLQFEPGGSLCATCSRGDNPKDDVEAARTELTAMRNELGL